MSRDPLSPNPSGAVTAGPTQRWPADLAPEGPVEIQRPVEATPRGSQWGLAALILGAPLFVSAGAQLQLTSKLWDQGPARMSPLAFAGCLLALAMTLGLGATGVFCGVRGLTLSVTERQPIAMGLAGSLLNAVAFLIWAGIGVDLLVWYSHR